MIDKEPVESIDDETDNWFNQVLNSMDKNIPKLSYKKLFFPRPSSDIQQLQHAIKNMFLDISLHGLTNGRRMALNALRRNLQDKWLNQITDQWQRKIIETQRLHKDPGKFWRTVKQLTGTDANQIRYIKKGNGTKLYDHKEQEEEFRNKWEKIYKITQEENSHFCADTERHVDNYLEEHVEDWSIHRLIDMARLQPEDTLMKPITVDEIRTTLQKTRMNKAPGQSKINKMVIISLPVNMIENMRRIYNAALFTGYFPTRFKKAIFKFIPKPQKDNTNVMNYRPFSLLENIEKVFEKIIDRRLRWHMQDNDLYSNDQHYGRPGRGTQPAIAIIYNEIAHSQQDRGHCNVVLRDVSTAFDKVWHRGLKYKVCQLQLP